MSRLRRARGRGQRREGGGRKRTISLGWPIVIVGVIALVGVIGFLISSSGGSSTNSAEAEANDDPNLPGAYVDVIEIYGGSYPETAGHVGVPVDYEADGNTNPPVAGAHWSGDCGEDPTEAPAFCGPARWGVYREPWDPETLVHNMEHAGAVLWYNTSDDELVLEIEQVILDLLGDLDLIVMAPYPDMEEETIALTSWSRLDKFSIGDYSEERVRVFMETHVRRFNPENI